MPYKWLPNGAAQYGDGTLAGAKRDVFKGSVELNYKDDDEKRSYNLMLFHYNGRIFLYFFLDCHAPLPPNITQRNTAMVSN